MARMITLITMLIFIDIFFVVTGQLCATGACSPTSIVFNALINIIDFNSTQFFSELIGDVSNLFNSKTGLAALLTTAAVVSGAILTVTSENLRFLPVAFSLALVGGDFVLIASYLFSLNAVLAVIIMGPLIMVYSLIVMDWLRGKD